LKILIFNLIILSIIDGRSICKKTLIAAQEVPPNYMYQFSITVKAI